MAGFVVFGSCSNESVQINQTDENGDEVITDVIVSADSFEPFTRTAVGTDLVFTWEAKDKMGVFPEPDPEDPYPCSQVSFATSAGGTGTATFNGSGWGLMPNRKYYAYFPYSDTAADSLVTFTLSSTATQIKNDTTTHLGVNDIMYSSATPEPGNTAHFQFHHLSSIMKYEITVPNDAASKKFTKVMLSCADPIFPEEVSFAPTDDNLDYKTIKTTDKQILVLGNNGSGFVPADGKLSVWFMTGATNLSGKTISVTVYDTYDKYTGSVQGADQKAGKAHKYTVTVSKAAHDDSDYYVDLGLPSGKKWATSNLTVNGLAFSGHIRGDYYAWGELEPYYTTASVSGTKLNVSWKEGYDGNVGGYRDENYNKNNTITGTYTTNSVNLQKEDDAAYRTLGGNWRIPSKADLDELIDKCTFAVSQLNGVSGVLVTSKVNGKTLFIPFNGYLGNKSVYYYGSTARLWLSDCYSNLNAMVKEFTSSDAKGTFNNKSKSTGTTIRPVYVPSE